MKIRSKLILMLAIPVIALAVIAFAGFRDQSAQAEVNERAGEIADGIVGLEDVALAVSDERLVLAQIEFADVNDGAVPAELTDQLEVAITATDAELASVDNFTGPLGADFASDVASVESTVLAARESADFDGYGEALTLIDDIVRRQPLIGFSPDGVRAIDAINSAREIANTHETVWIDFFELTPEQVTPESVAAIVGGFERVDVEAQETAIDALSNGLTLNNGPATSPAFSELAQLRALAEDDMYSATPDDISVAEVMPLLIENRAEWNNAVANASTFIQEDIGTSNDTIDDRRSLFTLLAVLGAFTVFTLMFVIGRSILGPLGRLMEHADKTTNERLPFAVAKLRTLGATDEIPEIRDIPRETNDEIGSLVDAFNDIQQTAVNIATDQAKSRRNVAEMFVSLGRRNQQLNHRMLSLISDLERDEQDPETLAGLYQLDHLATRMRRNAESLLVLAGNRSPRQWSRPVGMEDVVRQSLAEVELFERVEVGDLPELAMQGNVVTDVTHLLAELLDNATQFSEPSTTVQVSAQETLEGVEIEVFDEGFGIGEKDLIDLNERVTNPPALDEAPSRLLGLFVVGRLATQHGIDVSLQSQPGVGTVATVSIPSNLFAEAERAEIEAPSGLQSREATPTVGGLERLAGVGAGVVTEPEPDIRDQLAEANNVATENVSDGFPLTFGEPAPLPEALSGSIEEVESADITEVPDSTDFEALEAPVPSVEVSAPTEIAAPEVAFDADVDEAIPLWDPAAIHEEQLADASMPTMEEVEDAMPAFPGVTIAEPEVPAAPAIADDTWPLTVLDAAETPAEPSLAALDSIPEAPEVTEPQIAAPATPAMPEPVVPEAAAPEMAAPIMPEMPTAEIETPAVPEVAPEGAGWPFADTPVPEHAAPAPDVAAPAPELAAPAPQAIQAPPVVPTPEPPVVESAPLPAPPIVAAPAASMPQPEVMQAPESPTSTFGGLPTRSPQAALAAADETPAVIPLAGNRDLEAEAKPSNPGAFAAFASGVNRGLQDVAETPAPQFSNEGENE